MLRKFLGSAVVAFGVMAAATASQAASLGELTLTLTNGVVVNLDQDGGQSISADYAFINTLPGGDVLARYDLSGDLSVNGSPLAGGSLPIGVTTLNQIETDVNFLLGLFAPITVSDIGSFLASLPAASGGVISPFGVDIDVDLFTFTFTADATGGFGQFILSSPSDENYFPFIDDFLDFGEFQAEFAASASLTASEVPVPAALPLLGSGVLLMGFIARRRRTA